MQYYPLASVTRLWQASSHPTLTVGERQCVHGETSGSQQHTHSHEERKPQPSCPKAALPKNLEQ